MKKKNFEVEQVTITLDKEVIKELKEIAKEEARSFSSQINYILKKYLQQKILK